MQVLDYETRPVQTHCPKHLQPYSTVERESVYRRPGLEERRFIEIQEPTRERRNSPPRELRRSSRSTHMPRHEMVLSQKSRRRRNSSDSSSDSDYDTDSSSPRRVRSRRHDEKNLPIARANPRHSSCSTGALRSRSQGPPGPPRHCNSGYESSSDDEGGKKAQPKPPPKQILYTGLACIATIAAANNVYQSAKAHHARRRELEEGEISSAEAQRLKAEHRKLDLISLGVAAVGAYNVRNGWKRAEGHWKAHRERQAGERR